MLSIRTNLSSLITQKSFTNSSNALNQAIERMSTGFKLNHAKDNAANYFISTNISTQLGSYQVAQENTTTGLDMVTTASETLSLIEEELSKARALCVQARNGTYGANSMEAIKSELSSIVSNVYQIKNNTEYNGIKLLEDESTSPQTPVTRSKARTMAVSEPTSQFLAEVVEQTPEIVVDNPDDLADAIANYTVIGIANAETLAQLVTFLDYDTTCAGKTIVLTEDIDMSSITDWEPIGYYGQFQGNLNGNGHVIRNLTSDKGGLFYSLTNQTISNLGLEGFNISGNDTGSLVNFVEGSLTITNCYMTGIHTGAGRTGGLVGFVDDTASLTISDCYVTGDIETTSTWEGAGGLLGQNHGTVTITNSYMTGKVMGVEAGGLIGACDGISTISNSYVTGDTVNNKLTGALIGFHKGSKEIMITNCYYTDGVGVDGVDLLCGVSSSSKITIDAVSGKTTTEELQNMINNGSLPGNKTTGGGTNSGTGYGTIVFQVGIGGAVNSSIELKLGFTLDRLDEILTDPTSADSLAIIDNILADVSARQVEFGSVQNRLMSVLDEISIKYENLMSTRSTIRDADISEVSSTYIQQQILQQASATLLATANQTPDLALRLIVNSRI